MNGHKYVLFKYRIFDLLNQTYEATPWHDGIWYNLQEVAELVNDLSKSCVEANRYEVHAIKLCDIQTLAE